MHIARVIGVMWYQLSLGMMYPSMSIDPRVLYLYSEMRHPGFAFYDM